ncbi:MAG TPA: hypothetical protein VK747_00355, partial [Blastocatellia bacterium]|nr:hypothetical protein [Blastocatellia bacterium]
MNRNISGHCRCTFLILLLLIACSPAVAQNTDNLGGSWKNPASATITKIIMDRYARRRLEKNLVAKRSDATTPPAKLNEASLHFRPTGTQLKT